MSGIKLNSQVSIQPIKHNLPNHFYIYIVLTLTVVPWSW